LSREYPRREQVMQYGEDDLHFITLLLGETGIWFRVSWGTGHWLYWGCGTSGYRRLFLALTCRLLNL